jgi:sialate O-acetylesterase
LWTSAEALRAHAQLKGLRGSGLYNGMIAPLIPYGIRGATWYQGESNAGSPVAAKLYETLFPVMIADWRTRWHQGDFPFLFVQIAPWAVPTKEGKAGWPALREAQRLTVKKVPKTAMAVTTDVGDAKDIHPRNKAPVGARLALAALALAYGEEVEYSGPAYAGMKVEGAQAVVSFRHLGGGLVAKGGPLTGFTIAGEDGKFVPAKAEIRGDQVVVSSPHVEHPAAVRYGWSDVPEVNLWNKAGLPASPFRTDTFALK